MTKPEKLTLNFPINEYYFDAGETYQEFKDFFYNKSIDFIKEDLCQMYFFKEESEKKIIGYFTICCSRIETPKASLLEEEVEISYIPGLLIGYLITDEKYRRKKYGEKLLVNAIFIGKEVSKIAGCRYIIVDAYTTEEAIQFYTNLNFKFLSRTKGKKIVTKLENEEKPEEETTKMYFDLQQFELQELEEN